MKKRAIRITKHMGRTPVEAMCTQCQRTFQAPLSALSTVERATAYIQEQFDRHRCETQDQGEG